MKKKIAVLLGHGKFPEGLKDAIEAILGPQENFIIVSNNRLSLKDLIQRLRAILERYKKEKVFIFVDILGGSCGSAAIQASMGNNDVHIIGGVNLPMLVEFFMNKKNDDILDRIIKKAQNGIRKIQ